MVFSSMLFVFLFLVLNLLTIRFCRTTKAQNVALLIFSLVFYGWGGPRFLLLLMGMVFICWLGARLLDCAPNQKRRKFFLVLTLILSLGLLVFFKYTGFICENLQFLTGFPTIIPQIVLPIGISFYTFQLISYVIDVYRGEVRAQKKYWMLLLYAGLFHQCVAGPIIRYKDVNDEILHRRIRSSEVSRGITRFCIGLAKKAVLANSCAALADSLLPLDNLQVLQTTPSAGLLLGGLCYMFQIYLDFSAYSDMAIGMGLMSGFHYKENFNYPYIADSVTEFWRRWHISLSSFFRDYVYIPLGGNRRGLPRQIFNLFVVWLLTGVWHGASWNYILWGLYFFVFLVLEKLFWLKSPLHRCKPINHVLLLIVVYFSWLLFRFTDLGMLGTVLQGIFGGTGAGFTSPAVGLNWLNNCFFLIFCAIACTPIGRYLHRLFQYQGDRHPVIANGLAVFDVLLPAGLLVLSAMALVGDSYNPFLYFQF